MSSFGVVVCLSLFLSSAYPAPALNSDSLSVSKFGGIETKDEELRRLEMEKSLEYSKLENIVKKLFLFNAHFSDTNQAGDLRCETIKEDKKHFMYYEIKGKIFPKRKPVYVAETLSAVGIKKYFEISAEENIFRLMNKSQSVTHISFNKLKYEDRSVIEIDNGKAEPASTNQQEETLLLITRGYFIKNYTVKEISSMDVTKTSQHQILNVTYSGYAQDKIDKNMSQSLLFKYGNEYDLDNDTRKNTTNSYTIPHDPKMFASRSSQVTIETLPSFDSNSDSTGFQIYEYVTESVNVLQSSGNIIPYWDSTSKDSDCCKETTPSTTKDTTQTSSNVYNSNLTKNRNESHFTATYRPTTIHYDLKLPTYSYLTSFESPDKGQNITENDSNSTIKGIFTSPSISDFNESKINQSHFVSHSHSTSSTRSYQLASSQAIMDSNKFFDQVNNDPKQSTTFNNSTNKYQIGSTTGTTKSVIGKGISILNNSTEKIKFGESTFAPSISLNSPYQTNFVFNVSSTTHKDLQDNFQSNKTETNISFYFKPNNLTTERNLQTDYFQSSSDIDLSYNPSTVTNDSFSSNYFGKNYETNNSSKTLGYTDMTSVTDGNKWNDSKEQSKMFTLFPSSLSLNKTTGSLYYLYNSMETIETISPSIKNNNVSDKKLEVNKNDVSLNPLDGTGTTQSVIEKEISILNYITMTTEKVTLGEPLPTRSYQLASSQTAMDSNKFSDQVNHVPKQSTTFNNSTKKDQLSSTTGTTKSVIEKEISILNYSNITSEKVTLGGLSFSPSASSNSPQQTSSVSNVSSRTHEDLQDNSQSMKTESIPFKNQKLEPPTNTTIATEKITLGETSPTRSYQLTSSQVSMYSNKFTDQVNDTPKQSATFNNSTEKDLQGSTTGTTISVIEKKISVLNYINITTEKVTLGESSFSPSASSNSFQQTSSAFNASSNSFNQTIPAFNVSSTTHKDLQDNFPSMKTESIPFKNQKLEPLTNAYYTSSAIDEIKTFDYLTSETDMITDNMYASTAEYNPSFSSSSKKISEDKFFNTVTSPSPNNLSNDSFNPYLYTSSSFINNTVPIPVIFNLSNHSEEVFNNSQPNSSNFGFEFGNRSTLSYAFNNSESTSFTTKNYLDEESTNSDKQSNKTSEKETNYSVVFSTASLIYTVHNLKEHQSLDFQSESPESDTTQNIYELNETTHPVLSHHTYNTEKLEELSKEKNFKTSSLANFTSGLPVDKSSVSLTTAIDLLTVNKDEKSKLYDFNLTEGLTSSYKKSTKNVYNKTSTSVENNSLNYSLQPLTTPSVRYFDFTDSRDEYSPQSDAFIHKINGNDTNIDDKKTAISGDAFTHGSNTNYSHWNDLSVTQLISSSSDYGNKSTGVTIAGGNVYHSNSPKHLYGKSSQPSIYHMINNKTENLIEAETNAHHDFDAALTENSTTSIADTNEVKNIIDPLSVTENLTSNIPPTPANIVTNQGSSMSSLENVYSTPLLVSAKGYLNDSITEISSTESNIVYTRPGNMRNDTIITETNDTRNSLITGSTTNLDEIQTLIPERNYSVLTTNQPYNLTIEERYDEGSNEVTTMEIQKYRSTENVLLETTTQSHANPHTHSGVSDSVIIQDDGTSINLTTTTSVDTTKNANFTYTEKTETTFNINKNISAKPINKPEDIIFKTTPNSVTPISIPKIYDKTKDENPKMKTTTEREMTSSEKDIKTSSTSKNIIDFEISTQNYETMPSFNNFTFLLPTTDYLTSYLPVRIHPFIVFSEI
ncbi:unnamed protein product [Nezara viridula]|uniref:Uncharacterized protein n=1 Tax=Nezara viridula TaxID=85310 RepID=A0A9P0E7Z9_NEZVI|nr:unnamed protein product [Nezara viridula]